jgi:hypothetical protein
MTFEVIQNKWVVPVQQDDTHFKVASYRGTVFAHIKFANGEGVSLLFRGDQARVIQDIFTLMAGFSKGCLPYQVSKSTVEEVVLNEEDTVVVAKQLVPVKQEPPKRRMQLDRNVFASIRDMAREQGAISVPDFPTDRQSEVAAASPAPQAKPSTSADRRAKIKAMKEAREAKRRADIKTKEECLDEQKRVFKMIWDAQKVTNMTRDTMLSTFLSYLGKKYTEGELKRNFNLLFVNMYSAESRAFHNLNLIPLRK